MATLCFIDTETTGLDADRHEVWEVAVVLRGRPPDPLTRELLEHLSKPADPGSAASIVPVVAGAPEDEMYVWQLPVDLGRADPAALDIGYFHERRWPLADFLDDLPAPFGTPHAEADCPRTVHPGRLAEWCRRFAELTWGAHMIGMVPSFDTERLGRLLRENGACPGWHYQPIDVEAVAAGYVLGRAKGIALTALSTIQANTLAEAGGGRVPDIGQFSGALEAVKVAGLPIGSEEISRAVGVDPDKYPRHTAMGDACWARDVWDAIAGGPS